MAAKPKPGSKPTDPVLDLESVPAARTIESSAQPVHLAQPPPPVQLAPRLPPQDSKEPVGSAKRGPQDVYPVEFHGFMGRDANDQPVKVNEVTEGGFKWEVHDPRDIGPASRAKPRREPMKHKSRHRRLFYVEAEAETFRGLPGFKLLPPETHVPLTPTGPNVADHVTKTRAKPLTKG